MSAEERQEEENEAAEKLAEGTLVSHLVELRQRLVRATLAIGLVFVCLVPFAKQVNNFISQPMLASLPEGWNMISTKPAGPILVPLKTTFFAALFIAMPIVLYQAWRFIAPGLYRKEKRFALPLLVSSIALFYCGMAFAYYVVFPLIFKFFVYAAEKSSGFQLNPDINEFLSFVLTVFLAFGVAFETPIATFMLVWTRITSIQTLSKARPYVFLGAFVIGMLMTPPDVVSQILVALPMYLLYEGGLILSRILLAERLRADREESQRETSESKIG